MPKDVMITARVDGDISDRLARLAVMQGRSKSWVVGQALKSYLDVEISFAESVEAGRDDMREGRTFAHDEVAARFKARFGTSGR